MVSELKVQRGGYSNPLTDTMGNYLPIMYSNACKQMANGRCVFFPRFIVPHMSRGLMHFNDL